MFLPLPFPGGEGREEASSMSIPSHRPPSKAPPSFSPFRRWAIGFNVVLVVLVVLAVVVMVNYLSHDYFHRWHVNSNAKTTLAPRTVQFLHSLTNQVKVTVYYDRDDPFFTPIVDLLNEYRAVNRNLSIQIIDYNRDPGAAQQLKLKYRFLASPTAKSLIIFDAGQGRVKPVDGAAIAQYALERVPNETQREFRRKPVAFAGERAFDSALIFVSNPAPFQTWFLIGHGEHQIDDGDDSVGYVKFASALRENYIQPLPVNLLGTNAPLDPQHCNLLVIAGPNSKLEPSELARIDQYLNQGGRLFALFSVLSLKNGDTGLEPLLAKWGVNVTTNIISEHPDHSIAGSDVIVDTFGNHPIVNPLQDLRLQLILPRSIGKIHSRSQAPDAPHVEELAFSSPNSFIKDTNPRDHQAFPLIVAVEKGDIKGLTTERGTTRIVVSGDSIFLANHQIDSAANRDFGVLAANWLLDRPQLLEGVGPRPVTEYKLLMTRSQLQGAQWILLAAMPGSILGLGSLVWLRRRR